MAQILDDTLQDYINRRCCAKNCTLIFTGTARLGRPNFQPHVNISGSNQFNSITNWGSLGITSNTAVFSFPYWTTNEVAPSPYNNFDPYILSISIDNCSKIQIIEEIDAGVETISDLSVFPNLSILDVRNNFLSETDVNTILITLDNSGVINGEVYITTYYGISVPTGLGLIAVANLLGKGWFVLTDT